MDAAIEIGVEFLLGVDPATADTFANAVTATATTNDPFAANNSDIEATAITTTADLSAIVTESHDPVIAGRRDGGDGFFLPYQSVRTRARVKFVLHKCRVLRRIRRFSRAGSVRAVQKLN